MYHDTTETSEEFKAEKKAPKRHDEFGQEQLDPTPMQPPLGYRKTASLSDQIAQQVRVAQLKMLEDAALDETPEEADDFEIGEDFEPLSKHENDHVPTLAVLKKRAKEIQDAIRKKNAETAVENYKTAIKKAGTPPAQPADNDITTDAE